MRHVMRLLRRHSGKLAAALLLAAAFAVVWWVLPVRPRVAWRLPEKSWIGDYSNDGQILATRDVEPDSSKDERTFRLWDTATACQRAALRIDRSASGWPAGNISLSPDGKLVAIGYSDGSHLKIVESCSGDCLGDFDLALDRQFTTRFSSDGKTIAFRGRSQIENRPGMVQLWDVRSRRMGAAVPSEPDTRIGISSDGRLIATVISDEVGRWVAIWEAATGKEVDRFKITARQAIDNDPKSLTFSEDGTNVTVALRPQWELEVVEWSIASHSVLSHRKKDQIVIRTTEETPSGQRYSCSVCGPWIRIFDLASGEEKCALKGLPHPLESRAAEVRSAEWKQTALLQLCSGLASSSPDGQILAIPIPGRPNEDTGNWDAWLSKAKSYLGLEMNDDPRLELWDLNNGQLLSVIGGGGFAFSSDGKSLAVNRGDHAIEIWDIPPRKPLGWFFGLAGLLLLLTLGGFWWQARRRKRQAA